MPLWLCILTAVSLALWVAINALIWIAQFLEDDNRPE